MAKKIRKNVNTKKVVYRGIAVGMAAVMGGVPVSAAAADVSKEETVYVNADASRKYDRRYRIKLVEKQQW